MSKVAKNLSSYDYVPTNLNWLPNIPSHWELKRLKDLGVGIIGLTYSPLDIVGENDEGILVLRSSNIQNDKLSLLDNVYVKIKPLPKLILKKGDILICTRNGSRALIGKNICIDETTAGLTFGAFMSVFRTKYFRFVSYYFNSLLFDYQSGAFMTSTINQLTINTLNNLVIPFLPLTEQTQIVNYLDTKTQAIDKKINLLTTKVEYYKELRKTIINNAVTKGLDKNVKLKESELGLKPSHWTISRLKEVDIVIMGQSPKSDDYNFEKKGYPFLQGNAEFGNLYPTPSTWCEVAVKVINVNDIMLSVRAPIGAVNIANQKYGIGRGLCAIRAKKSFYKFLYYYFISQNHILQSLGTGTTYIAISLNDVANILVAFPPKKEQTEIATYLDAKTSTIDKICTNLQTQIETLKELRKTLINDVVTGKVKVN